MALAGLALLAAQGCRSPDPRPHILLFVMDTTRADAVSAYGVVKGTTPTVDALAAEGLRYTRNYAQAPWTLPSHASLFTGLLVSQHHVGWNRTHLPKPVHTLAEYLSEAGYATFGYSENPWVSSHFGFDQGFDRFVSNADEPLGLEAALRAWLERRDRSKPLFVFVNVVDPHAPYLVRDENPFVPAGADVDILRRLPPNPHAYLCRPWWSSDAIEQLRGLYLGEVAQADRKLRSILTLIRNETGGEHLVTIATSDHGEHFGESRLVSHQFSVREALLKVPLVVHGWPEREPALIDEVVQGADLLPSLLALLHIEAREALPGRPWPTLPDEELGARPIVSQYRDPARRNRSAQSLSEAKMRRGTLRIRQACGPSDRVFGDMRSLIRFPLKLIWYERYPAELYDLSRDPEERRDLAGERPEVAAALARELDAIARSRVPEAETGDQAEIPDALLRQLRALGYAE